MENHTILDGKVRIYKRPNTAKWHCAARRGGKNIRRSTNEKVLERAKKVAEDWYFSLRSGNNPTADINPEEPTGEKTFTDAAEQFLMEYETLTKGQRHPRYVKDHAARLNNYQAHPEAFTVSGKVLISPLRTSASYLTYQVSRRQKIILS